MATQKELARRLADLKEETQNAKAELKVREEQRATILKELAEYGVTNAEEAEAKLAEIEAEEGRLKEQIAAELDELDAKVFGGAEG